VWLILGKSSRPKGELQVYPGMIVEDYNGEIKITAQTPGAWRKK
jgi:hypothetical protein